MTIPNSCAVPASPAPARLSGTSIRRVIGLVLTFAVAVLAAGPAASQDVLDDLLGQTPEPAEDVVEIDAESDAADDTAIEARLTGIYGALENLATVQVQVSNGVVSLAGEVGSATGRDRAVALARSVQGVVDVIDGIEVDADVTRRLGDTFERLHASLLALIAALPVFLLALATVALFWWASGLLTSGRSWFGAIAPNPFIAELLAGVMRIAIILGGLVVALSLLDATSLIGTVLGAAGIVGLAVGFAVRDTVENYIASILLSLRTPFLTQDLVRIGENEGHVARLTGRATILISADGNQIRIPNAIVYKAVIVNYSRNPERRFEFSVGVDTDLDPGRARRLAIDTLQDIDGVLASPPVSVVVSELGDSNVTLTAFAWIDQKSTDLLKARGEAIRCVKQAFDKAGIVMPEPIYRLRVDARSAPFPAQDSSVESDPDSTRQGSDATGDDQGARASTLPEAGEQDTSADTSVHATLARELDDAEGENLLSHDSRTE